MSSPIFIDSFIRKRKNDKFIAGLLPRFEDPQVEGKTKLDITCQYWKSMFGPEGYTEFDPSGDDEVAVYFPKLGWVSVPKDCFIEADHE